MQKNMHKGFLNVAIVGGGPGCKAIMDLMFAERLRELGMRLVGVADIDPSAVGYRAAREKGIFTTQDYRTLYDLENLDLIIELTGDELLGNEISRTKPQRIRLMDNVSARLFWDIFRIEEERIAERKRVERAAREDGRFLQTVFDAIQDGLSVVDGECNIIRVNPGLERMCANEKPLVGKKCYTAYGLGGEPCAWCPALETKSNGGGSREVVFQSGVEGPRWIDLSAFPLKNTAGDVIGVIEHMKDITRRKHFEAELQDSESQKRAILDASVDMIRYVDDEMRIAWANSRTAEALGIPKEKLIGHTCHGLFLGRETPCPGCPSEKALVTGRVEHAVMKKPGFKDRNQERFWDCYGVPVRNGSDGVSRIIQVARDVTDQKLAEKELQRRHNELEAVNAVLLRMTKEDNLTGMGRVLQDMMADIFPGFETWILLLTPERDGFYAPPPNHEDLRETCYDRGKKRLRSLCLEAELLQLLTAGVVPPLCSRDGRDKIPTVMQALVAGLSTWMAVPMEVERRCHGLFVVGSVEMDTDIEQDLVFLEALIRQTSGVIRHQVFKEIREEAFKKQLTGPGSFMGLIGRSEPMQKIYRMIQSVANTTNTVLITGESGTGKELVARAIHRSGRYQKGPFVVAHCSSFVPTLVHSEIFGHEKGAFTGAVSRKRGRLERAQGGILFLDEVADLPLDTQVLLLRFLQDRSFERVGGDRPLEVNVRVVAATNKDVEKEMKAGRLREDFFYRLNVLPIRMPPLRERLSDVPMLAGYFLKTYILVEGKRIRGFDTAAMRLMMDYEWPGNVRELQNTVARCVVLAQNEHIGIDVLPDRIRSRSTPAEYGLAKNERDLILRVMRECNWNKHKAAHLLDVNRGTLYSKLKRYNIHREVKTHEATESPRPNVGGPSRQCFEPR
jgi:PAS domain S-box-containing protein